MNERINERKSHNSHKQNRCERQSHAPNDLILIKLQVRIMNAKIRSMVTRWMRVHVHRNIYTRRHAHIHTCIAPTTLHTSHSHSGAIDRFQMQLMRITLSLNENLDATVRIGIYGAFTRYEPIE